MKNFVLCLGFLALTLTNLAQSLTLEEIQNLRKGVDSIDKMERGFIIQAIGNFDLPMADMGKRFGPGYSLGAGCLYKTANNIYYQVFGEFLISNQVRQDSIFRHVGYNYFSLYDINGDLKSTNLSERGYNIGLGIGKCFVLRPHHNPYSGLLWMNSLSFMQHRINNYDPDGLIMQVIGQYAKGYDYLTNGLCINESINYLYYSKSKVANFSIGLNLRWGLTRNRRSYNFDIGEADNHLRNDIIVGLQFKWLISLMKKKDQVFLIN